jgi:hypothetical protein
VAALHLGAFEPHLVPAIATIGGVSSYSAIGSAEFYETPTFIEVPGVLKHYDLPDLMAAYALPPPSAASAVSSVGGARSVLVLGPTDAMRAALNETAAEHAFDFPTKFFAKVHLKNTTAQFTVRTGTFSDTNAAVVVSAWVHSLP